MSIRFLSSLIIVTFALSGCSDLQSAISPAYNAGYKVGEEFGSYVNTDQIDTINSWLPESDQLQIGSEFSDEKVKELCSAMFDVTGLLAGLKNNDQNRSDFSDGCLTGFNKARNA